MAKSLVKSWMKWNARPRGDGGAECEPMIDLAEGVRRRATIPIAIAALHCVLFTGCGSGPNGRVAPVIEFTKLPPAAEGSPDKLDTIEGRVTGHQAGQRIVLFARSGVWWVQPLSNDPFTPIQPDSTWKNSTHPGSAYAALLVAPDYQPPSVVDTLPKQGGSVLAVATAEESVLSRRVPKTLRFSGYEWTVRELASDRGGTRNQYDPANAWTDAKGFLHLRIARVKDHWTSAEISLPRSLGYGSYRFVVQDVSQLEPAAVFSVFTWDDSGPPREMDIEIGRWGEPAGKNAQYVIQPYYVPANVVRFLAPPGVLTHSFHWELGRVSFRTMRGAATVDEHTFLAGVPSTGNESIHINLYVFDTKRSPLQHGCEVIVEKFEYLP